MRISRIGVATLAVAGSIVLGGTVQADEDGAADGAVEHSIAREWNEELLSAIRIDFARPTIHARNLFHTSVVMWDAWAAYDEHADGWLNHEKLTAADVEAARHEAISYAAYRLLHHRFSVSPNADITLPQLDAKMDDLGYDKDFTSTEGDTPAAFGNRLAEQMIAFGLTDGSNEAIGYQNIYYQPINEPLVPALPGNPDITDPNRWQPLALDFFVDQSGQVIIGGYPDFLSPEWGVVRTFALDESSRTVYHRDGFDYWVYHDPGPPPHINGDGDEHYKWGFELVNTWSSHLDADDGVMWDISPASIGNAQLPETIEDYPDFYDKINGGDGGQGYDHNPATGLPYEENLVPRGDYTRILAEFWADGPASETPPGHWFTIANYVSDHPMHENRVGGTGPIVGELEWDVKTYLTLGGAMHDVAVAVWGVKGWYDYLRPISAIRYMCDRGQCTDPKGPSYDPEGVDLIPGLIEVVTEETIQPGERHEHLAGEDDVNVGKIAILAWRGHDFIDDPEVDIAGVGWILAENWWPYQRPSFVTPPFAGYVSGHSTFSRTAALIMTDLTGDEFFPGGMGEFFCPQNEFLVFEDGPSMDVTLQWARYMDASDQCSLSRIWGGIHPPADDIPGRRMGDAIAPEVWNLAELHFAGHAVCPGDMDESGGVGFDDLLGLLSNWGACDGECRADLDLDGEVGPLDLMIQMQTWGDCDL